MRLHVGSQVGSVRELLTTVGTAVGFLSCVRSHVSLQQPGTTEGFPAQLALVVVGVGEEVHVEGGHTDVLLVADVAALDVLAGELEVDLPVSGEVGARGEALAALLAFVTAEVRLGADLGPSVVIEERVHCEGFDREHRGRERRRQTAGGEL